MLPSLENVHFLHIGQHQSDPRVGLEPHTHPFHELIVMRKGRLHLEMRGETLEATAGDVLHYPPGWIHDETMSTDEPVEHLFIGFHWPDWHDDMQLFVRDQQSRIGTLAGWLYAERDTHTPGCDAARDAFLCSLLAEFVRLATAVEMPMVSRVRAQMRRRLTEPLTLDMLADLAQISKFHFVRRYKELAGRTPMQDLRHLRVQAARDLLLTTDLPLREISRQTGLRDEQHLSRLFRSIFRSSPGSYRRKAQQRRAPAIRGPVQRTNAAESESACGPGTP